MGLGRVELPTSPLSGVRSSQLSYRPSQSRLPFRAALVGAAGKLFAPGACCARKGGEESGFEDRLNVHTGYARTDHRFGDAKKRGLSEAPLEAAGIRDFGVHGNIRPR